METTFAKGDKVVPDEEKFKKFLPMAYKNFLAELGTGTFTVEEVKNFICTCEGKSGPEHSGGCLIKSIGHHQIIIINDNSPSARQKKYSGGYFKKV